MESLEEIRAKRLAEMRAQRGGAGAGGGLGGGINFQGNQNKKEEEQKKMEEMKNSILVQILDQSARARLNTLKVVKPEKAVGVENMLVAMAQRGQLQEKLGDQDIVGLLEKINQETNTKKTTVKFDRRRAMMDDSDDDLDLE